MAEDFEERTEQATPRRREKAREKGDIPKSRELTSVVPLWTIFGYLMSGSFVMTSLLAYTKTSLERGFTVSITPETVSELFRADSMQMAMLFGPLFALMLFAVVVVHFLQTGFLFTSTPLSPDLTRLDPLKGIKRLFTITTLYETVKGLFKIGVLGTILYFALTREVGSFLLMVDMPVNGIVDFSFDQVRRLVLISGLVLTIFAAADFAFQRWQFSRSLKMTKQEIREEYKEVEGSPLVRARMKSLQRDMARRRMMQEVPKADVVITNPTHFAIALKYDATKMGAPRVVAKGTNLIAEKIKEIAREHRVPTIENKPLAQSLYKEIDVGQEIPEIFYKAVAGILAQVYRMKGRTV